MHIMSNSQGTKFTQRLYAEGLPPLLKKEGLKKNGKSFVWENNDCLGVVSTQSNYGGIVLNIGLHFPRTLSIANYHPVFAIERPKTAINCHVFCRLPSIIGPEIMLEPSWTVLEPVPFVAESIAGLVVNHIIPWFEKFSVPENAITLLDCNSNFTYPRYLVPSLMLLIGRRNDVEGYFSRSRQAWLENLKQSVNSRNEHFPNTAIEEKMAAFDAGVAEFYLRNGEYFK
jgi:hypothetical protein